MLGRMIREGFVMGFAGDMNCAHTELDIHNPKRNLKSAGFTPVRGHSAKTAETGFMGFPSALCYRPTADPCGCMQSACCD